MTKIAVKTAASALGLTPSQKSVLLTLGWFDNPVRGAFPSVATIQQWTGLSRRAVYYALDNLQKEGFIYRIRQPRRHMPPVYKLVIPVEIINSLKSDPQSGFRGANCTPKLSSSPPSALDAGGGVQPLHPNRTPIYINRDQNRKLSTDLPINAGDQERGAQERTLFQERTIILPAPNGRPRIYVRQGEHEEWLRGYLSNDPDPPIIGVSQRKLNELRTAPMNPPPQQRALPLMIENKNKKPAHSLTSQGAFSRITAKIKRRILNG